MTQPPRMLEVKVGAFVVSALALLVIFVFVIGDLSSVFQPSYQFHVLFDSANGISRGSPVQYAGIEVGKVQAIQIVYPEGRTTPKVRLIVQLPASRQVLADDEASISTFGLLGEKYLEINPGAGEGPVIGPGGQLIGKPPVSTERIIERSNDVLTSFQQTLDGLNSMVGDPEARVYLKEATQEVRDAIRNWRVLGERLNLILTYVESGEGNVGRLLFREDLYRRIEGLVDEVRAHPWKLLAKPKISR